MYNPELFQAEYEGFAAAPMIAAEVPIAQPEAAPADRSKRHRTAFTDEQLFALESEFEKDPNVAKSRRFEIANELNLKEDIIKVWFQNRRMKQKKKDVAKLETLSVEPIPKAVLVRNTKDGEKVFAIVPTTSETEPTPMKYVVISNKRKGHIDEKPEPGLHPQRQQTQQVQLLQQQKQHTLQMNLEQPRQRTQQILTHQVQLQHKQTQKIPLQQPLHTHQLHLQEKQQHGEQKRQHHMQPQLQLQWDRQQQQQLLQKEHQNQQHIQLQHQQQLEQLLQQQQYEEQKQHELGQQLLVQQQQEQQQHSEYENHQHIQLQWQHQQQQEQNIEQHLQLQEHQQRQLQLQQQQQHMEQQLELQLQQQQSQLQQQSREWQLQEQRHLRLQQQQYTQNIHPHSSLPIPILPPTPDKVRDEFLLTHLLSKTEADLELVGGSDPQTPDPDPLQPPLSELTIDLEEFLRFR